MFRNLLVTLLLVVLGIILGVRYTSEGNLLGIKFPFLDSLIARQNTTATGTVVIDANGNNTVSMSTFWEVWNLLHRDYLDKDKLDPNKMIDGAIAGMVSGIGDPYTMYLAPEKNKETSEDLAGTFYGVGVELGYVENTLAVVAPLADGPGEKAGLKAGDMILHVKDTTKNLDEDTTGWTLDEAVQKIRGDKGVPVTLTIYRKGEQESKEYVINRDEIVVNTVTLEFLPSASGKQVAHLKISRFGERTESEWDDAVSQIVAKKGQIAGIIFDLRNNPGGYFDTSIAVASDFVKTGVVVSQQSQTTTKNYNSLGTARLANIPTVVLVNKGSASASEIVAGALHDDLKTKLIGEKTFGKGTVQDRRELSNGGGLHITIGRWLTPSGAWIHEDGIAVDEEVAQNYDTEADEVLDQALKEF